MDTQDKLRLAAQALGIDDPLEMDRAVQILGMLGPDPVDHATSARVVSELDAALAEHEGPGETTVHIGEVAIRIRPITPGQMMRFTAAIGGNASDAGVGMGQIMRKVVHPDDLDACWDAMDVVGWDVERCIGWVQAQVEVASGRPFTPSLPSREQRRHPSPSSNGASHPPTR